MGVIANLAVAVSAKHASFTKGMNTVVGVAKRSSVALAKVGAVAGGVTAAGVTAAGVALTRLTQQAFTSIDAIAKTSDKLGIATTELVGLQRAATFSGASGEVLNKALAKMQKNTSDAASGIGEAQRSFEALGINVRDFKNLSPEEQFKTIADRIRTVGNVTDRTRIAQDIFGRSGIELVNTLRLGREGLDEIIANTDKFGLAISRVDAKQIEDANDAFTRVKDVFRGIGFQIAKNVAPVVTELANRFIATTTEGEGLGSKVGAAIRSVAQFVANLSDTIEKTLRTAIIRARVAFSEMSASFLNNIGDLISKIADIHESIRIVPQAIIDAERGIAESAKNLGAGFSEASKEFQAQIAAIEDSEGALGKLLKKYDEIAESAKKAADAGVSAGRKIVDTPIGLVDEERLSAAGREKSRRKGRDAISRTGSILASELRFGGIPQLRTGGAPVTASNQPQRVKDPENEKQTAVLNQVVDLLRNIDLRLLNGAFL